MPEPGGAGEVGEGIWSISNVGLFSVTGDGAGSSGSSIASRVNAGLGAGLR